MIARGEADVVVAGGTEAALTGVCLAAFRRMGALSKEGVSRPFDARRDGFVMGEGAGVLVLERADHARARGATIFGRIAGYAATNDAFHITQPDPEGAGRQAGDARHAGRRRHLAERRGLRQRARHGHAVQRPDRDAGDQGRVQRIEHAAAGVLDEVGHRAPARRGRRDRGASSASSRSAAASCRPP